MNELAPLANAIESVLIKGDLSALTAEQRIEYNHQVCKSIGLNPLTNPLAYMVLNGKLVLYAKKDATDQLRRIHDVSVSFVSREAIEGIFVVTARATLPSGRFDESIGAVNILNKKGDDLANAMMKAETKAKRRVTLSICGLGLLDESEKDSIAGAYDVDELRVVQQLKPGGGYRIPFPKSAHHGKLLDEVPLQELIDYGAKLQNYYEERHLKLPHEVTEFLAQVGDRMARELKAERLKDGKND